MQTRQVARSICQSLYRNAVLSTSSSKDHGKSDFQLGGTVTTVTGRWTGRCTQQIQDKTGMGRWSGHTLTKSDQTFLHVLTAYRPVAVTTVSDSHTFFQQNWKILSQSGHMNPDPPKQFFTDLGKEITRWHSHGDDVILMLDANEAITDNKHILRFTASHNLVSLIHSLSEAPATYNRGSKCIDYILGSQRLLPCISAAGYQHLSISIMCLCLAPPPIVLLLLFQGFSQVNVR
jgi:hypothetical protein